MLGHIFLQPVKTPGWVGEQAGTSRLADENDACDRMLMKQRRSWVLTDTYGCWKRGTLAARLVFLCFLRSCTSLLSSLEGYWLKTILG